ncbi:response regulator [Agriterribacter sp.]|uniref:response regulator n=1 Tax=Agriterribacter sp. TaxID=2821509 RepID=UPI002BD48585|nr:response regulator [Agriterribacter sp.]HRO44636.1 response regulator [Agriterribacter sp.]HRQ16073.1 response regulator [Agriterribacter sp.]
MSLRPLANISILLVEDNEMNTLLASAIIQGTGANVTEADNGMDAIQLLRNRSFDLVLMDLHLPVMDGFETTRYIRNNLSLTVPVIAITANVIHGEESKCIEAGMNGFISKPYTEKELLDKIATCIPFKNGIAESTATTNATPSSALYNLSFLEDVSKGNRHMLREMIHVFVEQAPAAVSQLKTAYNNHNFNEMYAIAHRIKPDIDNLDIVSLKDDIRKIEMFAEQKQNGPVLKNLIINLDDTLAQVVRELKVNILS